MPYFRGGLQLDLIDLAIPAGDRDVTYGHSIRHGIGAMKDGRKSDFIVRATREPQSSGPHPKPHLK